MTPALRDLCKKQIYARGQTIEGWAKAHGYPPRAVYALLNGIDKGQRGRSHEIAVKLGLKPGADRLAA